MTILEIDNFFANFSFFLLFFSMISYWIEISFNLKKWNGGSISIRIANFCLLSLLILRWKESGHFPLSNLYESLMFLSWSLSTFHLILENIEQEKVSFLNFKNIFLKNTFSKKKSFLGAFTAPTALFINAFATFRLPVEMQQSSPLVPALQSNWLMMHVTVMILSYSALICGSLLSIAFLIITKNFPFDFNIVPNFITASNQKLLGHSSSLNPLRGNKTLYTCESKQTNSGIQTNFANSFVEKFSVSADEIFEKEKKERDLVFALNNISDKKKNSIETSSLEFEEKNNLRQKFAENLDNLSYRILGIGFPLLTIGILSGAVWANEAWGSYWSWDPKETWALATWFVFAIYLHTRLTKGWKGKKPAIIASIGFFTVWICFLGVNLLGEGLHTYGFLKNSG